MNPRAALVRRSSVLQRAAVAAALASGLCAGVGGLGMHAGVALAAPPAAKPAPPGAADAPSVASVAAAVTKFKCGTKPTVCNYGSGGGTVFDGFRWGMTHVDVTNVYNKTNGLFDQEYNPELVKMQPGREMIAKEHERDDRKRALDASFIQFMGTPTGYDATPIKNEYTYRNKESIQSIESRGGHRYFFFMGAPPGERLWKVYEEVRFSADGIGKSFNDAVTYVNTALGVAGRVRAADPSQNIYATTVDWQDDRSRLRLVDRSREGLVGVVLEDKATVSALPQLRANKAEDPFALDPSVQQITAGGVSDPNANAPKPADAGAPPAKKKK